MEMLVGDKHFSLLDQFVSYEKWRLVNTHPENENFPNFKVGSVYLLRSAIFYLV